jgi:hypothetical protein
MNATLWLLAIWWVTCGLAAFSLSAMGMLIVRRARRNRSQAAANVRREELKRMVWALMDEPGRLFEEKGRLKEGDRGLLLELFSELLEKIKGDYADRFVSLMRILGLMEECLARINSRAWENRASACGLLSLFNDPNVKLALYRALEDPVPEVRVEAARALVRLGAVRSVDELMKYLVVGDGIPSLAVMELFRNLGPGAVGEMLAVLEKDARLAAQLIAIDTLGRLGDHQAVPALLHLYDHPSAKVRVSVLQALGHLRDPRALPAVLLTMTDTDWEVRSQAAAAAGSIRGIEAIPLLEKLLEDEHWWVRYTAADALHRIGVKGVDALHAAATRAHPIAAEIAWTVLQEKGLAA